MLLMRYSPSNTAFWASVVTLITGFAIKDTRPDRRELVRSLVSGAVTGAKIGISLALIGMVAQTLISTGLGSKLASLIHILAGGSCSSPCWSPWSWPDSGLCRAARRGLRPVRHHYHSHIDAHGRGPAAGPYVLLLFLHHRGGDAAGGPGLPGGHGAGFPAGPGFFAPGAHSLRHYRGFRHGPLAGRGRLGQSAGRALLALPAFTFPEFSLEPILFIIPITLAPAIEHFGDIIAISSVTGRDYLKDPGIKNTMLGDGLATMAACAVGGPPNTTYSEVTGAVTLTRASIPP